MLFHIVDNLFICNISQHEDAFREIYIFVTSPSDRYLSLHLSVLVIEYVESGLRGGTPKGQNRATPHTTIQCGIPYVYKESAPNFILVPHFQVLNPKAPKINIITKHGNPFSHFAH